MAKQNINIGSGQNEGDGGPIRLAFEKINSNFDEVYSNFDEGSNGEISAANLTGALPAIDGSALTSISAPSLVGALPAIDGSALTSISAPSLVGALPAIDGSALTGITVTTAEVTGYGVFTGTEESFSTITGATGTVVHDCDNGHIFYHTTPAADFTTNFTNLGLSTEHVTAVSLVIVQGSTAYIPTAVEIGGAAQTLLWLGGSAPSGTVSGTDVVTFSLLNNGGTYIVLGQLIGFS